MLWLLLKVYFSLVLFVVFSLCSGQLWLFLWLVFYLSRRCYEKGKSKYFQGNLGPVLGKLGSSNFDKKRITPHSVFSPGFKVQYYLHWWKLSSYYFFINLGQELGIWSRNCIFPWQSAGDVHNTIWVGFCKAAQTSGLYDCQLDKIIACMYGPG